MATVADGTVVGFATTRPTDPGVLELKDLFVDPDAMRTGVARQLILRFATEAKREDVARIYATANTHAFRFHRAAGFVVGPRVDTGFGAAQRMHLDVASAQAPADPLSNGRARDSPIKVSMSGSLGDTHAGSPGRGLRDTSLAAALLPVRGSQGGSCRTSAATTVALVSPEGPGQAVHA